MPETRPARTDRIAIVGAGPSGLTAAHTLAQLGFEKVTVFERNAWVGGKVHSVQHNDRTYELGAYVVTDKYDTVRSLAEGVDLAYRQAPPRVVHDLGGAGSRSFGDYLKAHHPTSESLLAAGRYLKLLKKHSRVARTGLDGHAPALSMPFETFQEIERIEAVGTLFRPVFCSLGYGYFDKIPALYVLKFIDANKLGIVARSAVGLEGSWPRVFIAGFQELWRRVAAPLDIKLEHEVTGISRECVDGRSVVNVEAGGLPHEFDHVIMACAPHKAVEFMDAGDEESDLFKKVRTLRYTATLFFGGGLDKFTTTYVEQHQTSDTVGRTLLVSHPYPDGDLHLAYQFADWDTPADTLHQNLAEDVKGMGGHMDEVFAFRDWSTYFPHVGPKALRRRFYDRVEDLQGDCNTWWVGGLFNFETVEESATYARELVLTNFA